MMLFKADILRKQEIFANDGGRHALLRILLSDGTGAMALYRLTRWFYKYRLSPLAYAFQWVNKLLNGCVIGMGADFGPGFVIMHPIGIVINSKVVGGKNITLESGVVIGDEKGRSPSLGNDIFVGSGAKIIGDLRLGDGVKVGANAVVIRSADDGATLLGIPATPYTKNTEGPE